MKELIKLSDVNDKIICIRNENVILDYVVAELYGVQTMRINEAVKNNPDKFPEGYIIQMEKEEWSNLISKISISSWGGTRKLPKAFTEKGLYMLATILKSPQATQTTIAIVEAFAKLKQLANNIAILNSVDVETIEPEVIEKTVKSTGGLLNDLFFSGSPTSAETSFEFNLGVMKGKRIVKSEANPNVSQNIQERLDKLEQLMLEIKHQKTSD